MRSTHIRPRPRSHAVPSTTFTATATTEPAPSTRVLVTIFNIHRRLPAPAPAPPTQGRRGQTKRWTVCRQGGECGRCWAHAEWCGFGTRCSCRPTRPLRHPGSPISETGLKIVEGGERESEGCGGWREMTSKRARQSGGRYDRSTHCVVFTVSIEWERWEARCTLSPQHIKAYSSRIRINWCI